jgi:cytochrome P450
MSEQETAVFDPYYVYYKMRQDHPVVREGDGAWQVARYDDVRDVLRDSETYSSQVMDSSRENARAPSMLFSDAPVHNRLRKLVGRTFSPKQIAAQRNLITGRCEELMQVMAQEDCTDLITSLAAPLPVTVIAHMLGVTDGDMLEFKRWSDLIFGNIAEILFGDPSDEVKQAGADMDAYFIERIEELRKRPERNLLGDLVEEETEDGKLSDEELLSFCRLLLIAGNETTTGLILASVRVFHELPETFIQLKDNPVLIPGFVEETLRFYSPFSQTIRRTTRDVELAGVEISAGDLVTPLIASANRDEKAFDRAGEFIIDRKPNPHLAFGSGVHNCLGATLARLEGEIAVSAMTQRLGGISLVEHDPVSLAQFGGPDKLMVNIQPLH